MLKNRNLERVLHKKMTKKAASMDAMLEDQKQNASSSDSKEERLRVGPDTDSSHAPGSLGAPMSNTLIDRSDAEGYSSIFAGQPDTKDAHADKSREQLMRSVKAKLQEYKSVKEKIEDQTNV